MGWWTTNKDGHSFSSNPRKEMLWGDEPADIMGDALDKIVKVFEEGWERKPTLDELVAGVRFSSGHLDLEDE